jgi:hypothetical protein
MTDGAIVDALAAFLRQLVKMTRSKAKGVQMDKAARISWSGRRWRQIPAPNNEKRQKKQSDWLFCFWHGIIMGRRQSGANGI